MNIVISSGHGLNVPGARDIIDEVTEARRVTDRVAEILQGAGENVTTFHDNTTPRGGSTVNTINAFHNGQTRDLDVSVHFNAVAGGTRDAGIGVETMYRQGNTEMRNLASRVSKSISDASGLILRRGDGTWARTDLGFLNHTNINRAILLEICFVNSRTDVMLYQEHFEAICLGIAETLIGRTISNPIEVQPEPAQPDPPLEPAAPAPRRIVTMDIDGTVQDVEGYIENGATFVRLTDYDARIGRRTSWDEIRRLPVSTSGDSVAGTIIDAIPEIRLLESQEDIRLLKEVVHWEARGEDIEGQIMVANVIFNRLANAKAGTSLRDIIFQPGAFSVVALPNFGTAAPDARTVEAVNRALAGEDLSQGATFFHSISRLTPDVWHERATREGRLVQLHDHGNHRFYKEANR